MRKMRILMIEPPAGNSSLTNMLDPETRKNRMKGFKRYFLFENSFDYGVVLWDATTNKLYRREEVDEINPFNEIWEVILIKLSLNHVFPASLRNILKKGIDGVVLFIDDSDPALIVRGVPIYRELTKGPAREKVPFLILVCRQDLESTITNLDILRNAIGVEADVVPISDLNENGTLGIMLKFFKKVRDHVIKRSIKREMGKHLYQLEVS